MWPIEAFVLKPGYVTPDTYMEAGMATIAVVESIVSEKPLDQFHSKYHPHLAMITWQRLVLVAIKAPRLCSVHYDYKGQMQRN
jgi:hypothetical protein